MSLQLVTLTAKQTWYKISLDCGKSWLTVTATETFSQISRETTFKSKAWLTRSQISEVYKNERIAQAIVAQLSATPGTWRPHPEVPDLPEVVQYFVMVEDRMREKLEKVHAKKVSFQAQLDSDAASRLASTMVSLTNLAARPSPITQLDGTGNVNTPGAIPAAVPPGIGGEGGDPADTAARKVHAQMQAA